MFIRTALCAAALLLCQPLAAVAADPSPGKPLTKRALEDLSFRLHATVAPYFPLDAPGGIVLVVKDGQTVLRRAYGMADTVKGVNMAPEMAMRIGSMTKQFTATAILLLADEGKLSVEDEIGKYLPDYPTQGKKITIEHLLTPRPWTRWRACTASTRIRSGYSAATASSCPCCAPAAGRWS
ncbi:hypothetical protein MasN3_02740 [Massilia varians]|uniref:Beta-lactamase-related domain-containing protein n=1 Tax=Massilia varians TaxID=457921 RepID=A0ABM8C0S5_9BURK|nr:serine hydrolase domain-containing protein [Massilia varians]BDT56780.1 hypothetical protein MasN3_02740 [Massilia varians]